MAFSSTPGLSPLPVGIPWDFSGLQNNPTTQPGAWKPVVPTAPAAPAVSDNPFLPLLQHLFAPKQGGTDISALLTQLRQRTNVNNRPMGFTPQDQWDSIFQSKGQRIAREERAFGPGQSITQYGVNPVAAAQTASDRAVATAPRPASVTPMLPYSQELLSQLMAPRTAGPLDPHVAMANLAALMKARTSY